MRVFSFTPTLGVTMPSRTSCITKPFEDLMHHEALEIIDQRTTVYTHSGGLSENTGSPKSLVFPCFSHKPTAMTWSIFHFETGNTGPCTNEHKYAPESSDYREVRTTTSTLFQSFCTSPSARSLTAGSLGHGTKAGSALDKLAHVVPPRYQLVYNPDELQIYLP